LEFELIRVIQLGKGFLSRWIYRLDHRLRQVQALALS
jgi:hypothetical protein